MSEEKKNVKNSGSDSFLFSVFQRLVRPKGDGQTETPETVLNIKEGSGVPQEVHPANQDVIYDSQDILDTPADHSLLSYRMKWKGTEQAGEDATLRSFIYDEPDIPQEEVAHWMERASKMVGEMLEERIRRLDVDPADDNLDARTMIEISADGISAWCFIFPALNSGQGISSEQIRQELSAEGVISGIRDDRMEMAVQDEFGMKWFKIAEGISPEHGTDGTLTEHYSHAAGIPQFVADEKGNVDFHELNWLIKIRKGDEICSFTHASKGKNGRSVFGKEIKAKNGIEVHLPAGINTKVDKENCRVISAADGLLSYRNGKFHVSDLLEIRGDVATATGNINAECDVLIHGSIRSGYTVRSLGSIIVKGMVERSTVIAGRDVYIAYGMAGGGTGTLDAGGTVQCKYLENVNVRVTGDVVTESIVNSQVSCDSSIFVNTGRGVVVGGRLLAMNRIEAKIIGNKVNGTTVLLIEPSPHFQEIKMQLGIEYAKASKSGGGQQGEKKERLKKLIEELEEQEKLTKSGQIIAGVIYPVTEVSFQGFSKTIEIQENSVRLFWDSDGIKTGMV